MSRMIVISAVALLPCPAVACSLCGGDLQTRATLRQEIEKARIVVVGKLANAQLNSAIADGGTTDVVVQQVLKDNAFLKGRNTLTLPRYLPTTEQNAKILITVDVTSGKLDWLSGRHFKDDRVIDYARALVKLNEPNAAKRLEFFSQHLDSPVTEIADDAYLEFAKSADADVAQAAKNLDPARLRKLVRDTNTPGPRLGMAAFLLAGCGADADAELLLALIKMDTEQTRSAFRGLLAGYVTLRPRDGWALAVRIVADPKRNFLDRYAALGVARFFRGWKSNDARADILKVMAAGIAQGDLAEIPIEDLRRWGWWDLTESVLDQFGKKSHDFPMVRSAIARYALACPKPEAKQFIAALRKRDPKFVSEAEESLDSDRP